MVVRPEDDIIWWMVFVPRTNVGPWFFRGFRNLPTLDNVQSGTLFKWNPFVHLFVRSSLCGFMSNAKSVVLHWAVLLYRNNDCCILKCVCMGVCVCFCFGWETCFMTCDIRLLFGWICCETTKPNFKKSWFTSFYCASVFLVSSALFGAQQEIKHPTNTYVV